MKIKTCEVYGYALSYAHGEYIMSGAEQRLRSCQP